MSKEEIPEKSSGDDFFASPVGAARLGPVFNLENASGLGAEILTLEARREKRILNLIQQEEDQDISIRELRIAVQQKTIQQLRRQLEQQSVENELTVHIGGGMKAGASGPEISSPPSHLGSQSKAQDHSDISPAAKSAERALSARPLDTGDPTKAFLWLSHGLQYYKWGGSHFLGAFLSSGRI